VFVWGPGAQAKPGSAAKGRNGPQVPTDTTAETAETAETAGSKENRTTEMKRKQVVSP
jgi:hypothetical protein